MRTRLPWACLCLLAFCAGPVAADARVDEIAAYMRRLEKLGFSGAVLIARGDEILLQQGYGLADRERNVPWSARTVSTIGSITKQFTGAAILKLQERGKLNVRDSISRYFDGVPPDKAAITLHELLTHSSGIVDPPDIGDFDPIGREAYVRRVLDQPLAYPPGGGYEYANANYSLLGAIVEQLSGKSYEQFLRDEFFTPLGMKDTGYLLPRFDPARVAQGYRDSVKWGTILERPMAPDGPYWALRANGGIHATLSDMRIWCDALMDGKVLSPESMAQYWSPHVDEGGGESYYAYGWTVRDAGGAKVISHNGGNGIHMADIAMVPSQRLFIGMQCSVVADFRMASQLLEQLGPHLLGGAPLPDVPDPVGASPAALDSLAGTYRFEAGGRLRVHRDAARLSIEALDPQGFTQLFSKRPADPARAARLSARIDSVVGAYLEGDVGPIFAAYGGRASREDLQRHADELLGQWQSEFGALKGLTVLGTAFAPDRDETLVRIDFERGHVMRTYVWDAREEEKLLGVSVRGAPSEMRVWPDRRGGFRSFDAGSGRSRPLDFRTGPGGVWLHFEDPALAAGRP